MIDESKFENGKIRVSERAISRGMYLATMFLFCFPFVEISCEQSKGQVETNSRSGLQMALGGHTTTRGETSRGTWSGPNGNPWMTVFAVAVVAGLVISIVTASRRDWAIAELICVGVAQLALLFQFVFLDTYRSKLGQKSFAEYGSTHGRYTIWLYLTFIGVVGLIVLSLRHLIETREPHPTGDAANAALPDEPAPNDSSISPDSEGSE